MKPPDQPSREYDPATYPDQILAKRMSEPITGAIFFETDEEEAEYRRKQAEELAEPDGATPAGKD